LTELLSLRPEPPVTPSPKSLESPARFLFFLVLRLPTPGTPGSQIFHLPSPETDSFSLLKLPRNHVIMREARNPVTSPPFLRGRLTPFITRCIRNMAPPPPPTPSHFQVPPIPFGNKYSAFLAFRNWNASFYAPPRTHPIFFNYNRSSSESFGNGPPPYRLNPPCTTVIA